MGREQSYIFGTNCLCGQVSQVDWPIRTLGWKGALVKTGYSSYDKAAAGFTGRRPKSKETHVADLQHPRRITAR